jgi:hypothetical protein
MDPPPEHVPNISRRSGVSAVSLIRTLSRRSLPSARSAVAGRGLDDSR